MDIADLVVSRMKLCRVADSTNTVHHQTLQLFLDNISLQLLRELLILHVHLLLRVFLRVLQVLKSVLVLHKVVRVISLLLGSFGSEGLQVVDHILKLNSLRLNLLELFFWHACDFRFGANAHHLVDNHARIQFSFCCCLLEFLDATFVFGQRFRQGFHICAVLEDSRF